MTDSTFFVQFLMGLFLIMAGVNASCPIELSPPSVVVRYGDPVTVNCTTSETLHTGIGWEASQGGTGLETVNILPWTVKSLTEWDSYPSCFFVSESHEQCIENLDLIVYTFPENISIKSNSRSDNVANEGEEIHLLCDIINVAPVQNLTVTWYKDDEVIQRDTFDNVKKTPVDPFSEYIFKTTRQNVDLSFRCEADMDLRPKGPQLHRISPDYGITVQFGPDISCSVIELNEEETLEKACHVTGNPTPSIKWLKDGQLFDPNTPLMREDAGIYTIESEGLFFINKKISVFVLYGPNLLCPSTYSAMEYVPHNLSCTVEGYPPPETIWYKDGEELELPEILTRSDTGQYVITASNNHSSITVPVDITVLYAPSEIVELEDSEVDVGSTVWLKCSSVSNPRPTYSWTYYQTDNVIEKSEDGVSRLIIQNATANNIGWYTCSAFNERGSFSKAARVTMKGATQICPIAVSPNPMVVQYQSRGQSATCASTSNHPSNVHDIHWQSHQGPQTTLSFNATWFADPHSDWDPRPVCTAMIQGIGTCHMPLNFTLYKTPDSVSIHALNHTGSVMEDTELQLQCVIINVAPAQRLTVQWYRGAETIQPGGTELLQMIDCWPENNSSCNIAEVRSPVNVSLSVSVSLNRTHHGAEFRCEAQLDLDTEQTHMKSNPLNLTVFYKPIINTTKLPKTVPVFQGYPEELVCEADGHPPPKILWLYSSDKVSDMSEGKLTVYEAGFYNCTAVNDIDSSIHVVEVILKEDYLPLIAGFVAITVIIISAIFIFIYSIYYKNTKMRRYSLKNPKLDNYNGNVANNGWDLPLPMTKLT